jgi:hypothetical protein
MYGAYSNRLVKTRFTTHFLIKSQKSRLEIAVPERLNRKILINGETTIRFS